MRDRPLIFAGLALFVIFAAYPLWHAALAHSNGAGPQVQLPTNAKTRVAPRDYMRDSHMKLLIAWREGAVRDGRLNYTAYNGQQYRVSLSQTCLGQCHASKEQFCDRCHTYAAVQGPVCFDCHNAPRAATRSVP